MNALRAVSVAAVFALTGCASTAKNPADPLEPMNRGIYKFNETMDKAVTKPLAKGYKAVVPGPVKMMVTNFFSNLDDIVVTANDFLQFKIKQGISDGTRFVVNTTVGIYGLVDISTMIGLEKHNEDFGQTLGKWGMEPGPYLVLPFLGPSTFRDSIGLYVDSRPSKLRRVKNMRTRNQLYATKAINRRSQLLEQEKVLEEAATIDRYEFIRDAYLLRRKSLVYDGNPPREQYDLEPDDLEDFELAPINNMPSSRQETEPETRTADSSADSIDEAGHTPSSTTDTLSADELAPVDGELTADAGEPVDEPSVADPQTPSVHKVWVSQN